jgi:hypothetical protein
MLTATQADQAGFGRHIGHRTKTRSDVGPVAKRLLLALPAGAPEIGFPRFDVHEIRTFSGADWVRHRYLSSLSQRKSAARLVL